MHIADAALMDVALGAATSEELASARAHVAGCADCARLLRTYETAVGRMREASVTRGVVDRAWERTASQVLGSGRFDNFAGELAAWLDVDEKDVLAFLRTVDDESLLTVDCAPGIRARPAPSGPARAGSRVTFVRGKPDAVLPEHRHEGPEHCFVIQGALATDDGHPVQLRGDQYTYAAGTKHSVTALADVECYCFVIQDPS